MSNTQHQITITKCTDESASHKNLNQKIIVHLCKIHIAYYSPAATTEKMKELVKLVSVGYVHKYRAYIISAPESFTDPLTEKYDTAFTLTSPDGIEYTLTMSAVKVDVKTQSTQKATSTAEATSSQNLLEHGRGTV